MAKKKEDTVKDDPFFITDDDAKKIKDGITTSSSGVLCPKRNKAIGGTCKVCDYIQTKIYAKNLDENDPARVWARSKRAKLSWFMNAVLPENPDKAIFLEVGDKAGNQIEKGINKKGWRDIVHPHKGKGRELQCMKTKSDGYPFYSIDPSLEKADWAIPDKVWKNVPDLKDIIDILKNTAMTEDNYMHVRSLKYDESLTFRMCPPPNPKDEERVVLAPVFRHWGVTEDQINGDEPISWEDSAEENTDDTTTDTSESGELDLSFDKEEKEETPKEKEEKPKCFGREDFYEDDDEETCGKCDWKKKCAKKVMS